MKKILFVVVALGLSTGFAKNEKKKLRKVATAEDSCSSYLSVFKNSLKTDKVLSKAFNDHLNNAVEGTFHKNKEEAYSEFTSSANCVVTASWDKVVTADGGLNGSKDFIMVMSYGYMKHGSMSDKMVIQGRHSYNEEEKTEEFVFKFLDLPSI